MSVVSAFVYSHQSQVYKKHATEKTGTNGRETDEEGEGRRRRREGRGAELRRGEINTETVDHKKQDAKKRVGGGEDCDTFSTT